MATSYTPSKKLGDVLLIEVHPAWTKGEGVIVAGNHAIGTVLAKVGGKYQAVDFAGSGAAKKAVAVLGEAVQTSVDAFVQVVIERGAVVAGDALVWPDAATDAQKAAGIEDLATQGIVSKFQF